MDTVLFAASGGGFSSTLAVIAGAGIAAQWVAWRLQVPSIIVLLVTGLVLGPMSGLIDPDALLGESLFSFVALAVGLIMFEGGLDLPPREMKAAGTVVWRLVTVGAGITLAIATLTAVDLFGMDPKAALVLGAVLTVTGPTVIAPLLSFVRPSGSSGPTLRAEGIIIDPIGATTALIAYEIAVFSGRGDSTSHILLILLTTVGVGIALGVVGAFVLDHSFKRFLVPDSLGNPVALAFVIVGFVVANSLQEEAGLITVTVMGMWLARRESTSIRRLHEFNESLRTILLSVLFVLLAARVEPAALLSVLLPTLLFLAVLVFVARPAAVIASTIGTSTPFADRVFLAFVCPRGIVAAAISSVFGLRLEAAGVEGAEKIGPIVFLIIIFTIVLYGFSASPLARKLGLADDKAEGVLIVGGNSIARSVASQLARLDITTLIVDTDPYNIKRARRLGLNAVELSILTEEAVHDLDLRGIGRMLAVTSSDEVNALATSRFERAFGRANTYQLHPNADTHFPEEFLGRIVGTDGVPFTKLDEQTRSGWRMRLIPAEHAAEFIEQEQLHALAVVNGSSLSLLTAGDSVPTSGFILGQCSPQVPAFDVETAAASA